MEARESPQITLRHRRIKSESEMLAVLARANPGGLEVLDADPEPGVFRVAVCRTCGILKHDHRPVIVTRHEADISLPRFFPAAPIEARLLAPVFHPNVDPINGFVCLWDRFSAGDTVVVALRRLQQIIAWNMFNVNAQHLMQPEAAAWRLHPDRPLPLEFTPLLIPPELLPHGSSRLGIPAARRRLDDSG